MLQRDLEGIKNICYRRSMVKKLNTKKGGGSTASWIFAFLLILRRQVIIASLLRVMLGIVGLAGSKNETSCGGCEINVAYVH